MDDNGFHRLILIIVWTIAIGVPLVLVGTFIVIAAVRDARARRGVVERPRENCDRFIARLKSTESRAKGERQDGGRNWKRPA